LDRNILFLCFEINNGNDTELHEYLKLYPNLKIGKILTAKTFRTNEYSYILDTISTRPAVTEEVFKRAIQKELSNDVNIYWSFDYLRCSGSILQYYQFWKIWQYVIEYELENNMKFDNVVRSRSDIFINKPVLDDMYNIVKDMYENNLLQPVNSYADWWWDCTAWTFLNLYYLPYRIPSIHSDVDRWVSQFSLNGIKSNICRPN
jgi:hypothetical protein